MRRALTLLVVGAAASSAFAVPVVAFPTHCRAEEFAVVNARMSRVVQRPHGVELVRNGKLLSLCADKPAEPFERLAYRYGPPGLVELERVATRASRFGIVNEFSPHVGEESLTFVAGKARLRVTIATPQGSGVSLSVHEGGRQVVDLFSGNDAGVDFELGPARIDFDAVSSPIFFIRGTHGF